MYYISQIYLYCDIYFTKRNATTEIKILCEVSSTTLLFQRNCFAGAYFLNLFLKFTDAVANRVHQSKTIIFCF